MGSTWRWDGMSWRRPLAVVITLLLIQALISVKTTAVTGKAGETFHFRCEYPNDCENSTKYLCSVRGNNCTLLIRADKHNEWVKEGRFSLYDNTSTAFFIVGVEELRSDDSGTYWCGVDRRNLSDHLSVIELNVSKGTVHQYITNVLPASTTDHTVNRFTLQLFLTAALCVVALVFVCLFTFCLLLALKQKSWSPSRKNQTSSQFEAIVPAGDRNETDRNETDLCSICTDPNCPYISALPMPPADPDVISKHRQSILSLGFSDYADIDVPSRISQYQHLNISEQEDHVYASLHENGIPKPEHTVTSRCNTCVSWIKTIESCEMILTKVMRVSSKVLIFLMAVAASLSTGNGSRNLNNNCSSRPLNQTAYVKSSVTINCTYPKEEESMVKLFCRRDENFNCDNIISAYNSDIAKKARVSLKVDKHGGVYTVVISPLTQEDAGIYWCALKTPNSGSVTCLNELHLHVLRWDEMEPIALSHAPMETANIRCPYPKHLQDSEKFLCKGENPSNCDVLIRTKTDIKFLEEGRFRLRENKRLNYFDVDITDLEQADFGTYWCISGESNYTRIQLSVAERNIKTKKLRPPATPEKPTEGEKDNDKKGTTDESPTQNQETTTHIKGYPVIIGGIVMSMTLLLLILIVVMYRLKRLMTQAHCATGGSSAQTSNVLHNTEGNNEEHEYEELALQNQQQSTAVTMVYATVSHPSDMPHYATINFGKDKNKFSEESGSPSCDSSAHPVTRPSAETTIYCTVKNPGEQ
ncbi:uncharacterized protein LOC133422445 [Cololabis saira]|uniref:uncharacterized protein LOC133422445 n=1 Tax=Cololabis saira TaxID=129043 RepID=UPI002AD3D83C|nr:uncharacterized protein LOC133422445 [Cololabis saira]